jgi:beta-lactamase regulating signal transducer with metallopeptidase domain/Tol biopolymer transport system component
MTLSIDWLFNQIWAQSWQVTAVILGVGLLTAYGCRHRPHLAYILWLVVLVKCLTPPLWQSPTGIFSWAQRSATVVDKRIDYSADQLLRESDAPPSAIDAVEISRDAQQSTPFVELSPIEALPNEALRFETSQVASNLPASPANSPSALEQPSGRGQLAAAIVVAWFAGAALYFIVGALAIGRCLRAIRTHQNTTADRGRLEALVRQLSQQLGLRRSVRLALVNCPLGPIAYGCLRPTVVIPHEIAESRSSAELEPLLAHELIHIRRGDAFIGLLQMLAQGLFWFHPLVWWANRRMTAERERCCDEEVIAGLNCATSEYARSLLRVVELKQQSRWPAALPGIRPYEITKQRLEHVMKKSHTFRKRTPRAFWLILFIAILLLVPGAAFTESKSEAPIAAANPPADSTKKAAANNAAPPTENAVPVAEDSIRVSQLISPDGKRIAYGQIAVGPDGEQRVRIVVGNVDGTDRRALPIDAESVDEVQWFGNEQIAFVTEHGQDGYSLIDLQGKSAGRLSMPFGCDSFHHQCLSPDGRWIAFCGNYAELPEVPEAVLANIAKSPKSLGEIREQCLKLHPNVKIEHGLFVANLKQQTVKHLFEKTIANLPAWSRDSKRIAAGVGSYVREYPLVIADIETGKVEQPNVQGVGIAWSPDHKYLAMTTDVVRGGSWLGGVPLDGALGVWNVAAAERQLLSPAGSNISVKEPYSWVMRGSYGPVWSPDGEWIAYRQTEKGKRAGGESERREEVWIVRRDGSDSRKVLNHGAAELAWTKDGKTLLYVAEGRFGRVDREIDATALGPTPAVPAGAFTVRGRVTDAENKPLQEVEIRVSRGMGTLFSTDPVKTNADGWYEIHFGPAMHSAGSNTQYACVFASKAGYFEKDLCRNGNLTMANFKPKGISEKDWGVAGTVYPGNPYRVDFVMLPAAKVMVQLVNPQDEPLANYEVHLSGDKLYPATGVLWSGKTDSQGRLVIDRVPMNTYHFSVGSKKTDYRSEPISFNRSGDWQFRIIYDDLAGTLVAKPN